MDGKAAASGGGSRTVRGWLSQRQVGHYFGKTTSMAVDPAGIQATTVAEGREVPIQLVPDEGYHAQKHVAGTVVFQLPAGSDGRVRLKCTSAAAMKLPPHVSQGVKGNPPIYSGCTCCTECT